MADNQNNIQNLQDKIKRAKEAYKAFELAVEDFKGEATKVQSQLSNLEDTKKLEEVRNSLKQGE